MNASLKSLHGGSLRGHGPEFSAWTCIPLMVVDCILRSLLKGYFGWTSTLEDASYDRISKKKNAFVIGTITSGAAYSDVEGRRQDPEFEVNNRNVG